MSRRVDSNENDRGRIMNHFFRDETTMLVDARPSLRDCPGKRSQHVTAVVKNQIVNTTVLSSRRLVINNDTKLNKDTSTWLTWLYIHNGLTLWGV